MDAIPLKDLDTLSATAWKAREHARLAGPQGTKVGVTVLDQWGRVHPGCNLEHRFRAHDIHGEVSALARMASINPEARAVVVLVAADHPLFTPCGSCLDWVFQLGGPDTRVIHERRPCLVTMDTTAVQLMPHYPR